jgi:hypothetical protein
MLPLVGAAEPANRVLQIVATAAKQHGISRHALKTPADRQ